MGNKGRTGKVVTYGLLAVALWEASVLLWQALSMYHVPPDSSATALLPPLSDKRAASLWATVERNETTTLSNLQVVSPRTACQHGPRTSQLARPLTLAHWTRSNTSFLPLYHDLTDYWDNIEVAATIYHEARCEYNIPSSLAHHFPHSLQNLYSCWSYWQYRVEEAAALQTSFWQQWSRPKVVRPILYIPVEYQEKFNGETLHTQQSKLTAGGLAGFVSFLRDWGVTFREISQMGSCVTCVRPRVFSTLDGYAMASPLHATRLRQSILQWLQLPQPQQNCSNTLPRITILDRKGRRQILHVHAIRNALEKALYEKELQKIPIVYFENASFAAQVAVMSQTDILISPHGAQLTTLALLPDCASLLEIFPFRYCMPFSTGPWRMPPDSDIAICTRGILVYYNGRSDPNDEPPICAWMSTPWFKG